MPFLPEIRGRFKVGCTTFVHTLPKPMVIGQATMRKTSKPALQLEQVVFSAYYPTNPGKSSKGIPWINSPISESLRGWAHFGNMPTALYILVFPFAYILSVLVKVIVFFFYFLPRALKHTVVTLEIPVYVNSPLLNPQELDPSTSKPQWPLVIFSHGLGGSRTTYSQICARLAASGRVVLAVEHHDGSGHMFIDAHGNGVAYIQEGEVKWEDESNKDPTSHPLPLRTEQLELRRHEIYLTHSLISQLSIASTNEMNSGSRKLSTHDSSEIDWSSWNESRIRCSEGIFLTGHSFGGATVLSILANPPSTGYKDLPIAKALVLDPWLEPFASPGPEPYASSKMQDDAASTVPETKPKLLVINSEGFTLWKPHFERLEGLEKVWQEHGWRLVTVLRSRHVTFSDVPFLPIPFMRSDPNAPKEMDVISDLSDAFLGGRAEDKLLENVKTLDSMVVVEDNTRHWKKAIAGDAGDVLVHI